MSTDNLKITLAGESQTKENVGSYTESGIKSITYGNINVTNSATVTYTMSANGSDGEFYDKTELETFVNKLPAGTYTINYNVTYLGITETKTRTVILR